MKSKQLIATITVVLVAAVALAALSPKAEAQDVAPFPSREKTISVTGTAITQVKPDFVHIQFGVETQEKTAKEALETNSALLSKVVEKLKSIGVSEDEIMTSSFNIYPVYDYHYDSETRKDTQELIGYRVSNILGVETKKLDLTASIIDGAVEAGTNRVDNVYFTLSPESQMQVKDSLLESAIKNAKSKAEKALLPLDHSIIGVKAVSLSEFSAPPPMPFYNMAFDARAESLSVATPVFTSDQDVTTTVNVVFIIGSN